VVFEVSAAATKTEIKEAVQQIFKVKVTDVAPPISTADAPRGQSEGYRRD